MIKNVDEKWLARHTHANGDGGGSGGGGGGGGDGGFNKDLARERGQGGGWGGFQPPQPAPIEWAPSQPLPVNLTPGLAPGMESVYQNSLAYQLPELWQNMLAQRMGQFSQMPQMAPQYQDWAQQMGQMPQMPSQSPPSVPGAAGGLGAAGGAAQPLSWGARALSGVPMGMLGEWLKSPMSYGML